MGAQKSLRCRLSPHQSRSNKRWRCHTVDCPCSLTMDSSALVIHRHSFPSEDKQNQQSQEHQKGSQLAHQPNSEYLHHSYIYPSLIIRITWLFSTKSCQNEWKSK